MCVEKLITVILVEGEIYLFVYSFKSLLSLGSLLSIFLHIVG